MKTAMQGFGVGMTEERARALSKHPFVEMVEEDEEMELSDAADEPFDTRAALAQLRVSPDLVTDCRWYGSYYACYYNNDIFWHLDRLDNQGTIYSTKAYAYNTGGTGVRAYVLDFGVHAAHVEFSDGRVADGANMLVDPETYDTPQDPNEEPSIGGPDYWPPTNPCGGFRATSPDGNYSHGTAVASVLGGRYTGVAKGVTIVPVKVISCSGFRSKLAVARGLDWALADLQARGGRGVVSMSTFVEPASTSWNGIPEGNHTCEDGNGGYTNCLAALEHVINKLGQANVPVVVSANNQSNGNCTTSPARMGYGNEIAHPSPYRTITVGGTMYGANYADQRWTCAAQPGGCDAFGPNNPGSNFGPCVSVWAPAWHIHAAGGGSATDYRDTNNAGQPSYGPSSGTSFSAPYVAGIVARLLERNPTWTTQRVYQELVNRANRPNMPDFDPSAGIVNRRLVYLSPFE